MPSPSSVRQHKIHFYRQIAFTFIGAALVVLIGVIYFSLSQAVVTITPALETITADFNVLVKADGSSTGEEIDARFVSAEVSVEKTAPGELLAEGDAQQATGKVTLKNTSGNPQPLVATTRLQSEQGVLFRLKKAVTVPAKGEVEADVYADQPGKAGEIGPSRFIIPGLNQARQQEVFAESKQAMTGGTKSTYRVTSKAVEEAVEAAKQSVVANATEDLKAQGIEMSKALANAQWVNIVSQEVTPAEGSDAQQFTVKVTAQVAFVLADQADIAKLAQTQLHSNTSLGYEISSSDAGSLTYSLANVDLEKQTAQLRVYMQGKRRISSNNPLLDTTNFVGMKPAVVKEQLEADPGIESVDINLRPFWLRRIPRLADHIYIQFAS
jgi:hypothetical protein